MHARELAREFARQLRAEIGDERMTIVNMKNATVPYAGSCASHDYCDANVVMMRAYTNLTGIAEADIRLDDEATVSLFNYAWDTARDNNFYMDVRTGDRE